MDRDIYIYLYTTTRRIYQISVYACSEEEANMRKDAIHKYFMRHARTPSRERDLYIKSNPDYELKKIFIGPEGMKCYLGRHHHENEGSLDIFNFKTRKFIYNFDVDFDKPPPAEPSLTRLHIMLVFIIAWFIIGLFSYNYS